MSGFLPEIEPFTGIRTDYSWDSETESLVVKRSQNCDAILDRNKALFNDPDQSWRKSDDRMYLFASIPNMIIEKWLIEDGINVFCAKMDRKTGQPNEDMRRVLLKLKDPDWRYLRTHPMSVG